MKRFTYLLAALLLSNVLFSQDYGDYSLPHTVNLEQLKQYIGQQVQVFDYHEYSYSVNRKKIDGREVKHDEYIFEKEYIFKVNRTYTIENIKIGKQIVITLADSLGRTDKAKININNEFNYEGMQSCKSFFLVDKFWQDKKNHIGKKFSNHLGVEVAEVVDVIMANDLYNDGYPTMHYVLQSNFMNAKIVISPEKADALCRIIGTELKNNKVKSVYFVNGAWMEREKYSDKPTLKLAVTNSLTGKVKTCKADEVFNEDLEGNYYAILSKVEKPSNPEIRYGSTTIKEEEGVSKYSYKDNVIDILIGETSSKFAVVLKNVSDNTIKIIWDEAVFVGYNGNTSKVMHTGTKYSQREEHQPASVIIRGASITDVVIPNDYVEYNDYFKTWLTKSIYPLEKGKANVGQFILMLPIQIKDVINEYMFIFDIGFKYKYPERIKDDSNNE